MLQDGAAFCWTLRGSTNFVQVMPITHQMSTTSERRYRRLRDFGSLDLRQHHPAVAAIKRLEGGHWLQFSEVKSLQIPNGGR
jgi:hypothetical protein